MINEISLVGFKSFLDRTLKLNRLTILTGLNSSGKSSIIQALNILEKAYKKEKNILLEGHGSIDEMKNIYYNQAISLSVRNELDQAAQVIFDAGGKGQPYEFTGEFQFPEIIYISANRFGPKTSVPIFNDSFRRDRIGPNGENLFQFIDSYAYEPLHTSLIHPNSQGETVEYNIAGWLSVISPNIKFEYKLDQNSDTSYSLFNGHRSMNVGFGLSYSLSVIATLLIGTLIPNSLVIIENPEAHLHPRGQTEIAKLITLCSYVGTQVIIETHSDHLFDGIRIMTKKIADLSDFIQIHWFELNEHFNTEVESPTIDKNGRLNKWPAGLFDQFEINASNLL